MYRPEPIHQREQRLQAEADAAEERRVMLEDKRHQESEAKWEAHEFGPIRPTNWHYEDPNRDYHDRYLGLPEDY